MKKVIYSLFVLILFSCSSGNKYEILIGDYVQTDKSGKWTDLQFKAIEITELEPITVSDSISILKTKFEAEKSEWLSRWDASIKRSKEGIEKEQKSRIRSKSIIDMYNEHIATYQHRIDSLNNVAFSTPYDNEKPDKTLLIPLECQYSVVLSPYPLQKMTEIFYYSPAEDKIIRKTKKK